MVTTSYDPHTHYTTPYKVLYELFILLETLVVHTPDEMVLLKASTTHSGGGSVSIELTRVSLYFHQGCVFEKRQTSRSTRLHRNEFYHFIKFNHLDFLITPSQDVHAVFSPLPALTALRRIRGESLQKIDFQ